MRGGHFVFAGLWDRWNETESFAIITTEPNGLCSKIHDRMPVILAQQEFTPWLDPSTPIEQVGPLLRPHSDAEMESFPVSRLVNSPKTDSEACVQRIDLALQ